MKEKINFEHRTVDGSRDAAKESDLALEALQSIFAMAPEPIINTLETEGLIVRSRSFVGTIEETTLTLPLPNSDRNT